MKSTEKEGGGRAASLLALALFCAAAGSSSRRAARGFGGPAISISLKSFEPPMALLCHFVLR